MSDQPSEQAPRREYTPREGGAPRGDRGGERPGGDRGGPRGDRGGDRGGERGGDRPGGDRRRRVPRRKVCYFTLIKAEYVDYKDVKTLERFVSDRGKILPRRMTGTSAHFQRLLTTAIKRARHRALLPYVANK